MFLPKSTVLALGLLAGAAQAALIGPSPYLSFDDSPFQPLAFSSFHLETFEDHVFDVPGVTASAGGVTSVVFGPSIHDSVDGDDGAIDGSGLNGDSFYSPSGGSGITFSFTDAVLPTHAGLVWTDAGGGSSITFRVYGAASELLFEGTYADIPDFSNNGETAEDRFFGYENAAGISAIFISNSFGGIEVDHLQYGLASSVPEPASGLLMAAALAALVSVRRGTRRG